MLTDVIGEASSARKPPCGRIEHVPNPFDRNQRDTKAGVFLSTSPAHESGNESAGL
jgi:hypothetical protein